MVSNELEQLLNGKSGILRKFAPEPLLLPRIASRITPEGLRFTASATNILSSFWVPYGWPALADAAAQAIAYRHLELSNNLLRELCDKLPQLPFSLIELDDEAGERVDTIIGSDAANLLREALGDSTFYLREAVSRVFSEPDPPLTSDELITMIRERSEIESPEIQRELLAYFLPLVPVEHHQWMIPILINVLGIYPGWAAAVAASRVAGFLDTAAAEHVVETLKTTDAPWASQVHDLLTSEPAGSEFDEVVRALPDDGLLQSLLASETDLVSLDDIVDKIMLRWTTASFAIDDDEEAEEPDETGSEWRLQMQVFADDDGILIPAKQGFMKGTRHDVRLWIGPDTEHSIGADVPISEPSPDAQELKTGSMDIVITLVYDSKSQTRKVQLPVDRKKHSKVSVLSLAVDKDSEVVGANILLKHKGQVFQNLKLNGLSLEEPDTGNHSDSSSLSLMHQDS